jgi:hypothetical protein
MTDQREQQAIPAQPTPASGPWADYLAAAQRLDAVRRAASSAAVKLQEATEAAGQELAVVRAQLATQAARLTQDFGVPEEDLRPQPADRDVATQAVAAGPAAALAALEQAHRSVHAADALIIAPEPTRRWRPWARNLLIYGPFAAAVLIVQIALYLVAPAGTVPTYALLCGLAMPVLAFGLGWVTIGFVYGGDPGGVDRTPTIGVAACLTPVLLTCMGVGLAAFFH